MAYYDIEEIVNNITRITNEVEIKIRRLKDLRQQADELETEINNSMIQIAREEIKYLQHSAH